MDRETLQYLADIAAVRGHINSVLNVSRGAIQQKVMHQISAKATVLDRLFVDTLLSGRSPGSSGESLVQQNNDDFVDIAQRLQEEKAKIANQAAPSPTYNAAHQKAMAKQQAMLKQAQAMSPPIPDPVLPEETDFDDDVFRPPADEVEAFEALLAQAEAETAEVPETPETPEEPEEPETEPESPQKKKGVVRRKKAAKK